MKKGHKGYIDKDHHGDIHVHNLEGVESPDPHASSEYKSKNREHGIGGIYSCDDDEASTPAGGGATPASNAKHYKG